MKSYKHSFVGLAWVIFLPVALIAQTQSQPPSVSELTAELDAFWAEVSRTVQEGDFEGYAALYHEDAIMVNANSGSTYPIGNALEIWKPGFDDTKAGRMAASVEFRFSKRMIDENTAFETGIFRYVAQPDGEEAQVSLIHFDALSIKKESGWVMMMEHQITQATQQEWEALREE